MTGIFGVRIRREEGIEVVCHFAFLDLANRTLASPDAGEEGEGPGLIESKPDR